MTSDKLVKPILVLGILTALSLSEASYRVPKNKEVAGAPKIAIFKKGKYPTSSIQVLETSSSSPPFPLTIYSPTELPGSYAVFLFLHAACMETSYYSTTLQFVATHGHIIVAPQLYTCTVFGNTISGQDEIDDAAKVINWISSSLQTVLPSTTIADLNKLTLGGHGRGAKSAFAIALGHSTVNINTKVAALIALDPVAGTGKGNEEEPKILTAVPHSLDLTIPKTIIGTGKGNETICAICPSCAPNNMNHVEFYKESKPPMSHIVVKEYGHVDILDDDLDGTMGFIAQHKCVNGPIDKDPVRKTVGGIMAAFLNAYFARRDGDYKTILHRPVVSPATLLPPEFDIDELNARAAI